MIADIVDFVTYDVWNILLQIDINKYQTESLTLIWHRKLVITCLYIVTHTHPHTHTNTRGKTCTYTLPTHGLDTQTHLPHVISHTQARVRAFPGNSFYFAENVSNRADRLIIKHFDIITDLLFLNLLIESFHAPFASLEGRRLHYLGPKQPGN